MTRTFVHEFDPPQNSPVNGRVVQLTVQEIEDAGYREVTQSPGPAYGSWEFLDSLLQPGTPFIFRQPLGQAREVKVALSGLFGRFVARAYLLRYFGLSIFYHPNPSNFELDAQRQIRISRLTRGDLPDWVACDTSFSNLTVVEAKGCHDQNGPARAIKRAWDQAVRIDVLVSGRRADVNRLAIVTRWGMKIGGPPDPLLSVRDPIDEGDSLSTDEQDAIFVGLFRHHVANILSGLGYAVLAGFLRDLTTERVLHGQEVARPEPANRMVDTLLNSALEDFHRLAGGLGIRRADLIGRFITRGPISDAPSVSRADLDVLFNLGLRPRVVGFESELVRLAFEGDPSSIRDALVDHQRLSVADRARSDGAGFWIIPLED